jgi:hypothetical protein
MEKKLEQLVEKESWVQTQLAQVKRQQQRLENRRNYYESGDRKKRTHRLITRGAAIESIVPEIKPMSETEFYEMMEHILSMPEVNSLVLRAATKAALLAGSSSSDAANPSPPDQRQGTGG